MKIRSTLITSFSIIVFTLLSVSIGNANPDSVGTLPLADDILRHKVAFAVVEEEIAHHLNLGVLTEWDYQKIRGSVLWKIRAPIHSLLREQFGKIVNTVDFGTQLDAGSPSQSPPTNRGGNKPVLHKKAAEIIRDFIDKQQLSVIIGSNAPIGIGETAAIRRLRGEVRYTYDAINGACVIIPIKNLTALIKRPFITEIWPDAKGSLKLQHSVPQIGADKVHNPPAASDPNDRGLGVTGEGVRVAVVDTGIDTHQEFGNRIEDVRGWIGPRPPGGSPKSSHGTHVAGIIGAADENGGETGVAPNVTLLDAEYKILGLLDDLFKLQPNYSDAIDAIQWAAHSPGKWIKANQKADVINMSLGWNVWDYGRRGDDKMSELIDTVVSDGVVFVMSAGNEGKQRATGDFVSNTNASVFLPPHSFSVNHLDENGNPISKVKTFVIVLWETELIDLGLMLYDSNNNLIAESFTPTSLHQGGHFYYERLDFTSEAARQDEVDYEVRVVADARENGPQNYEIWGGSGRVKFDNPSPARTLSVPGYSKKVITVGNLVEDWHIYDSSSRGPTDIGLMKPEVVAPGFRIKSTVFNNEFDTKIGTSMAAPHVAGVAALILDAVGKNSSGEWNFNPDEVKSAIVRGAERGSNSSISVTPDNTYGAGLVKADNIIFGGTVPAQGELRFEITAKPRLIGSRFGSDLDFLNAENTYPAEGRPFLKAAISWEDSKHNLDLVLSDANGNVIETWKEAQSNYEKISTQTLPQKDVSYYLAVTNKSNEDVFFTGASIHPIKPATISIRRESESTSLADIALIIDSSSSMGGSDPGNLRKSGAELFITSADPKVQIAIVDFHASARKLAPLTFADTAGKITLKNAVDRVHSSGNDTNIDAGLQQGFQELDASTSAAKKAAVLLTDGRDSNGVGQQVISDYVSRGWPIYTIGLGNGVDRAELERIAHATGGEYFWASQASHIQTVYNKILAKTTYKSVIASLAGYINKGQQITKDVLIDENVDKVDVSCDWPGSTIELVLIDPDGTQITPQDAAANSRITYQSAPTYAIYTLENPKPGNWQMQATGTDIPAGGERFNLSVKATSDFLTNFLSLDSSYAVGDTIRIGIEIDERTGDTFAPVLGATTSTKIVRPDGRIDTLTLYDDGSHNDVAANDGVYANNYRSVDKQGTYLIKVSAENGFSREIQEQVVVGSIKNVFIDGSTLTPAAGATLKQTPNVISAVISGPAGKINANSIVLKVDGKTVSHTYNRVNQLVSYRPGGLSGGSHNVQLSLRNASGNTIETTWQFTTQVEDNIAAIHKHTLTGHTEPVWSVAFSPDGRTLVSGSRDKTIHWWDVSTGRHLRTSRRHTNEVGRVMFSPDGQTLASAGNDVNTHLWDVNTGRHKQTLIGREVVFSPDGQTLATSDWGTSIYLWDVSTGKRKKTLTGHTDLVLSISFSPDGQTLASGSADDTIRLWDARTGRHLYTFTGHTDFVLSISFSPDGQTLASGSADDTIRLWDVSTRRYKKTLTGHTGLVRSISFSPDGQMLASGCGGTGSDEETLRLWDVNTGKYKKILAGVTVNSVVFSPDGQTLASGNYDGKVHLWELTPSAIDASVVTTAHLYIYWTDSGTDKIQRANPDGSGVQDLVTGVNAYGLALDVSNGKMYWTDSTKIQRANLDGTGVQDLVTGLDWLRGIALDVSNRKMYWIDWGTGKIQCANLDGSGVQDLVTTGLRAPQGLALDVSNRKMYWMDRATGTIQRANLDGTGVQDLVTGLRDPAGLALDVSNRKMYWTDVDAGTIQRANLDGSGVEDLVTGLRGSEYIALDVSGGKMYWTDNRTDKIQRANLDGTNVEDLVTRLGHPQGIALAIIPADTSTPPVVREDVNGDGVVDLQDTIVVTENLGQTGKNDADVNGDGVVNVEDLLLVLAAVEDAAGAPALYTQALTLFTAEELQQWLIEARGLADKSPAHRRGILMLEQLLALLTPKETALLPNYPNPFNPETWIPYRLAAPAKVTLTIYAVNGQVVRTLALGHQAAGFYENRSRAAYWDGRNAQGEPVASGVYFYTLTADDFSATRKMLIRK